MHYRREEGGGRVLNWLPRRFRVKTETYRVVKKYQCEISCFSNKCNIEACILTRINHFTFCRQVYHRQARRATNAHNRQQINFRTDIPPSIGPWYDTKTFKPSSTKETERLPYFRIIWIIRIICITIYIYFERKCYWYKWCNKKDESFPHSICLTFVKVLVRALRR